MTVVTATIFLPISLDGGLSTGSDPKHRILALPVFSPVLWEYQNPISGGCYEDEVRKQTPRPGQLHSECLTHMVPSALSSSPPSELRAKGTATHVSDSMGYGFPESRSPLS